MAASSPMAVWTVTSGKGKLAKETLRMLDAKQLELTSLLLFGLEELDDLLADFAFGHADIVLLPALVVDEVEETVINVNLFIY